MTSVTVCCTLCSMKQNKCTEAQVIQFARDHGYKGVTPRKLKRFRQERVLPTPQIDHLGFGPGTTSVYPAEAGQQILEICRLLKQKRSYDAVRFQLWLKGYSIEIGLLKESIWRQVPWSSLSLPESGRGRSSAAKKTARIVLRNAWKSVRSNLLRKFLQQFARPEDQKWFLSMLMLLLFGEPVDFSRDFLSEYHSELHAALEDPADVMAHGLQIQHIQFIQEGEDVAKAFQKLADEQLLSLTRLRTVLFAASTEEFELARTRQYTFEQMFESLDLMGYLRGPLRLYRKVFSASGMQVLVFAYLLVLEQGGYGRNIDIIAEAIRTNLSTLKQAQALLRVLQKELPEVAAEILTLPSIMKLFTKRSQQEQATYLEHLRETYKQHQEEVDSFRGRHPDLFETQQTTSDY